VLLLLHSYISLEVHQTGNISVHCLDIWTKANHSSKEKSRVKTFTVSFWTFVKGIKMWWSISRPVV